MVRRKARAPEKQARARQQAIDHETEKERQFRGSAKIDLQHLTFDTFRDREYDQRNEQFLVDAFRRNGCVPLDATFHIPGLISEADLDAAVTASHISRESLFYRNPAQLPHLNFPSNFRLHCLSGKHRIDAARKCLAGNERWWVVELYSDGEFLA